MVNTVVLELSVHTTVLFSACAIGMRSKLRQIAIMLFGSERRSRWLRSGQEAGGDPRGLQARLRTQHLLDGQVIGALSLVARCAPEVVAREV